MAGYFDRLIRQADAGGARPGRPSPAPPAPQAATGAGGIEATEERMVSSAPPDGDSPAAAAPPPAPPPSGPPVSSAEPESPHATAGEPPARARRRGDEPTATDVERSVGPRPPEASDTARRESTRRVPVDAEEEDAEASAGEEGPYGVGREMGDVTGPPERATRSRRERPGDGGDSPSRARAAPEPPADAMENAPPADPSGPLERRSPRRHEDTEDRVRGRGRADRADQEAAGPPEDTRAPRDDPYRVLAEVRNWVAATPAPGEVGEPSAEAAPTSERSPRRDTEHGEGRDVGRDRRAPVSGPLEAATQDVRLSIGRIELTLEGVDRPAPAVRRPGGDGRRRDRRARSRLRRHYLRLP